MKLNKISCIFFTLFCFSILNGQPARTFVLGGNTRGWAEGGSGIDPVFVLNTYTGEFLQSNSPNASIDYRYREGSILPLRFEEGENIAFRVLKDGKITAPTSGRGLEKQLEGTVNGDHTIAFERKPTLFEPRVTTRGIWIILDFGTPIGVSRVRFYPRNTVVSTPEMPFHNDFLRGYELWINKYLDSFTTPDKLILRDSKNEDEIVDIQVPIQYARYVKIKSLVDQPFEIDEVEVYGTGFLQQGIYYSDVIDFGDRAGIGRIEWIEKVEGASEFSSLSVRVRTGLDDTPLVFREYIPGEGQRDGTYVEVAKEMYAELEPAFRGGIVEDTDQWSSWFAAANSGLISAPNPRRYVQFRLQFDGELNSSRVVEELTFSYLQPPIAGKLTAEVYPREMAAEEPASFRYAVRIEHEDGLIRGYDRIEVDTGVRISDVRQVKLNGEPYAFNIDFVSDDRFGLSFSRIYQDNDLLEFTFDIPIFRFGTTFSGRAYSGQADEVPQAVTPGNATNFDPSDIDELSGLSVAIPKQQIGNLIGDITVDPLVITPNGDGVNEKLKFFFNVLQLTRDTPVSLELFDLSGKSRGFLINESRGIGPVELIWDGRLNGIYLVPGIYIWQLRVRADAFDEFHTGTFGVAY